MDEYMVALIYGDNGIKSDGNFGKVEKIGKFNSSDLHSACLLELARDKFPEVGIFHKLNFRHQPNVIGAFFTKLGHAIFINISNQKSKMGILLLPDDISKNFKDMLYSFSNEVENYNILLAYNLRFEDGLLKYESLGDSSEYCSLEKILDAYFNIKTSKVKR